MILSNTQTDELNNEDLLNILDLEPIEDEEDESGETEEETEDEDEILMDDFDDGNESFF
jgi:hypothetical protein